MRCFLCEKRKIRVFGFSFLELLLAVLELANDLASGLVGGGNDNGGTDEYTGDPKHFLTKVRC